MKKSIMILIVALSMVLTNASVCMPVFAEATDLTNEQKNAIAMLNYITVLTREINASQHSRVYMEDAYSSLINNTAPDCVDERTLAQLNGLLDTMEAFRMSSVKRDRIQYIYEQNKAQAVKSAIPTRTIPVYLIML